MTQSTDSRSQFTFEPNIYPLATTLSPADAPWAFEAETVDDPANSGPPTCGTQSTPTCPLQ